MSQQKAALPRERVVYILGAGFSAPVGIPTMNDCLLRSKDQFVREQGKFPHFDQIFSAVDRLAKIKNVIATDLFNIEEILSILEMEGQLRGGDQADLFARYICDVVRYHTPSFEFEDRMEMKRTSPWISGVFGTSFTRHYLWFVASLFGLRIERYPSDNEFTPDTLAGSVHPPTDARYAIVTLNYDTVLEQAAATFRNELSVELHFRESLDDRLGWDGAPYLAKLHGSVQSESIVPPTWSKGLHESVLDAWKLAHRVLAEATQIRIIGYSLPVADSYIKYLLRSAVLDSFRLKRIEILCLDRDGSVSRRFNELLDFKYARFQNMGVENYFPSLPTARGGAHGTGSKAYFALLEEQHRSVFGDGQG